MADGTEVDDPWLAESAAVSAASELTSTSTGGMGGEAEANEAGGGRTGGSLLELELGPLLAVVKLQSRSSK